MVRRSDWLMLLTMVLMHDEEVGGLMEGRGMGLKLSKKRGLPAFGYHRNFLDVLDNSVFEGPSAN